MVSGKSRVDEVLSALAEQLEREGVDSLSLLICGGAALNAGPTSILRFGLPTGLLDRVVTKRYGKSLSVSYLGRYDQIHFKLYAVADQGPGKHLDDLLALRPTREELESAALWCLTHDVSETFRIVPKDCLSQIGYPDVAGKL
jgi:hypothetical protein